MLNFNLSFLTEYAGGEEKARNLLDDVWFDIAFHIFNGRKDLFHMTLDGSPQAPLSHEDEDAVLLKAPVIIAKVSIAC
jgi:hypothetical protein